MNNAIRRLIDIIRFCIISVEALLILAFIAWFYNFPSFFVAIGAKIKTNNEIWKLVAGIPFFYVPTSIKFAWKILVPSGNSKMKILHQWKDYWRLHYRVITSIIICGMAATCPIIIWIFSDDLSESFIGLIFISSITVPIVAIFNQLLAAFKIHELIDLHLK